LLDESAMSASSALRLARVFCCTVMLFGAAGRAAAQPGSGPRAALAVTATVLTKCSIAAGQVACSDRLEVPVESRVETLRVDGEVGRFVVATVQF
jgi:hypothetical protein